MYQQHGDQMASAIKQHLTERNTEGYRKLASAMLAENLVYDGMPTAGPGVSVREDRGQVIVGVGSSEYDLPTAIKLGLVSVSRNA